ncbi:Poly(A) polymerase pla1 [Exophiala dermatitidis]
MAAPGQSAPKQWGVSPPISTALPEPLDNEKTAELIEELKRENNYEPMDETKKRMSTLALLNRVTQEFVREVSRRQRLPPSQIDQFGGKIYPYGSYRLGVFGPGSDIDTLAVAPRHVTREDFFEYFPAVLERMAGPGAVTSLTAVPDSFVPIIKLVLNGIEIDLIFASIASLQTIPKDLSLNDNNLLMGLDQPTVRAVTGPRVTDEILSLVPEHKTFRTALRAIKLWAQRRAIYANIVGYPGGVAWAMLVARVCQLYPHAVGATIVDKFFFVISHWDWPTPVMLKDIEQLKNADLNKGFRVWNPAIYPGDRKNIMPIITPAFPSMCATYNISKSGKKVILNELKRGGEITNKIFAGKAKWSDLFKKHTFFTADHKYYLSITASSLNADSAKAWAGLVESKVRIFVMQLEAMPDIELARPFTKGFKRVHKCADETQIREVQKGTMKYKVDETKTMESTDPELVTTNGEGATVPSVDSAKPENEQGAFTVYTYSFYIGIDTTAKSLNLVPAFQAFKEICENWAGFNRDVHYLSLSSSRNWDLPDDLFDTKAGEVKPTKPVKKTVKTAKAGPKPARRSISEVEDAEANGDSAKRQKLMTPTPTPTPAAAPTAAPA